MPPHDESPTDAALPRPLRAALVAAGREGADVRRVLVLPTGDGGVARRLAAAWPRSELTALESGTLPIEERSFDLIWADGLFTRLDDPGWAPLLAALRSALDVRGIAVLTTHGRATVDALAAGHDAVGLPETHRRALVEAYGETAFGYVDDPRGGDGASVASLDWVIEHVLALDHVTVVHAAEAAWEGHRDVVAFMRA